MNQEEPCEAKTVSIEPKTPNPNVPDSIPPSFDSDSSLSEEETTTKQNKDRGMKKIDSISSGCVLVVSDEEIIESIYQNLLRIIVSAASCTEIWCFDGCKTPPPSSSSSRNPDSKMVPDTCPGAPMKLTKISRNIDSGLRRKLF